MGGSGRRGEHAAFGPFVPRLVADWMAEAPDERYRQIEGSMVFTDLSGFTAMSEKLATLGRLGAEELTQHLDVVFTDLLEVAGGYGASLLKFGGDALLLFFWGDDHELRAAAAAVGMQRRLKKVGVIRTSAGRIRLAMTVGVHAGAFDFFLVGDTHRELLVSGPAASRTAALESSAQPGQVIVSGAISSAVRKVDAAAVGSRRGRGVELVRAPRRVAPGEVVEGGWPEALRPGDHVPVLLREEIADGTVLPEHRQMVVGFVHLANVDELFAREGPAATAAALDSLMGSVQSVFAEHGVGLVSSDVYDGGPKLICSTGAIRSWENDDERMLRALREVLDLNTPVVMRAGVHRGHGFRGPIGPPWRRTFAVMGDVVNTAARVTAKAEPGELWSTPEPLRRSDTEFATEALVPFVAKGKAELVEPCRVGEITGVRDRLASHRAALVGRSAELSALLEEVSASAVGRVRFIDMVGEAGMGKSRLVDELERRVGGTMRVRRAQCGRYAQSTPYLPIRILLRTVVGESASDLRQIVRSRARHLEPWLPLLALPLDVDVEPTVEVDRLDPKAVRERLNSAAAELLSAVIAEPTLWVIEDVHWADEASRDLLGSLATGLEGLPLTILTTRRPDANPLEGPASLIELAPLDHEASRQVIRDAARRPLASHKVSEVAERAQGNPLYLEELAAALSDGADAALPDTVEGVVAARLDALEPTRRQLVRRLSVLGMVCDRATADAVVGQDSTSPRSWDSVAAFVECRGPDLRFRHALTRDVAYEGLPHKERQEIHIHIARHLERRRPSEVALLALHFAEGRDHVKAWRYGQLAAEDSEKKYAFATAATQWARAMPHGREAAGAYDVARSLERLGHCLMRAGDPEAAEKSLRRARRLLPDDRQLDSARVARRLGDIAFISRRVRDAERWYRRAIEELVGIDARNDLARVHAARAEVAVQEGAWARVRRHLDEAGQLLGEDTEDETLALYLTLRYRLARHDRDPDIDAIGVDTAKRLEGLGHQRLLAAHLIEMYEHHKAAGDWQRAEMNLRDAGSAAERSGNFMPAAIVQNNLGELLFQRGLLDEAEESFRASHAVLAAAGSWAAAVVELGLVRVALARGELDQEERLEALHDSLRSAGMRLYDAEFVRTRAELLLWRGRCQEAIASIESLLESARDPHDLRIEAVAQIGMGDRDRGIARLREALDIASAEGNLYEVALCLFSLGKAAGDPAAAEEAAEMFERLGFAREPAIPIAGSLVAT